jgi:hypothetical protein
MPTTRSQQQPLPAAAAPEAPKSNVGLKVAVAAMIALVGGGSMLYQQTLEHEPVAVEPSAMSQASVQALTTECKAGTLASCIKLSRAYADGSLGLTQDGQKATDLLYPACKEAKPGACDALTKICDELQTPEACSKMQEHAAWLEK